MAQPGGPRDMGGGDTYRYQEEPGGWVLGFTVFAGVMMIMIGIFGALQGLVAIFDDDFFVVLPNYTLKFSTTAWGWIHLILGIIVVLAGVYVFTNKLWARIIGIIMASLAAIANFFFIPYYPIWSLLIIALCVFVIWALAKGTPVEG